MCDVVLIFGSCGERFRRMLKYPIKLGLGQPVLYYDIFDIDFKI